MTISYTIQGITLNEGALYEINKYYEAACTAEYIAENYGLDEELSLKLGYEIRRKMDKYGYSEEEAINIVFMEKGIEADIDAQKEN